MVINSDTRFGPEDFRDNLGGNEEVSSWSPDLSLWREQALLVHYTSFVGLVCDRPWGSQLKVRASIIKGVTIELGS
jgi:hypothetical protein